MLLNTGISIAVKNFYGQYEIKKFSLFEMETLNKDFSDLNITLYRNKEVIIKVKCPFCNEHHHYNYNISEFVKREMVMGGCESLGMPLFFIGNNNKIEQKISKTKEIKDKICAMI